jgi:P pilus assembly chaperone PapD
MKKGLMMVFGLSLALMVGANSSFALNISPIPVNVANKARYATVTVDDNAVTYQGNIYAWTQVDGQDVLTEAKDAVVSPGIFKTPKKVRLAFADGRDKSTEKTYRLILTELAGKPDKPETTSGIRYLKTLDLPVFLHPANPIVNIEHTCNTDGTITITNKGNVHAKVEKTATDNNNSQMFYILPGSSKTTKAKALTLEGGQEIVCGKDI